MKTMKTIFTKPIIVLFIFFTAMVYGQNCINITDDPTTENSWGYAKNALIGDLNNDGANDLLITHEMAGGINEVDFYYIINGPIGATTDISVTEADNFISISPFFTNDISEFYYTKPLLEDINNDGIKDLFLIQYNRAYVFFGPITADLSDTDADIIFARDESFIDEIIPVGDVTGNGFSDIMVLQSGVATDVNIDLTGTMQIFEGPFTNGIQDLSQIAPFAEFRGAQNGDYFGSSGGVITDINGDGLNDISVYASEYGECGEIDQSTGLCVFFNNRQSGTIAVFTSPIVAGNFTLDDADILFRNANIPSNNQTYIQFGREAIYGSDFNGDGEADFAITSAQNDVYIFNGPFDLPEYNYTNAINISGNSSDDFGRSIAGFPDLNNDGKDELIVGAPNYSINPNSFDRNLGRAYLFSGPTASTTSNQSGIIFAQGESTDVRLASKIVVGDLDGDGISDLGLTPNKEFSSPAGYFNLCFITEDILGINNFSLNDNTITLTPNPTKTTFSIQSSINANVESITIYSLSGSLIKTVNNPLDIDVSNLSNGVYIIKVNTADTIINKRLVVSK